MSNEQNLKRFDRLTESERREIAAKAGRASGAARQRRKDMKELLEVALTMPSGNGDETNDEAIVAALIRAAREGRSRMKTVMWLKYIRISFAQPM